MIALACDHTGIELKKEMMKLLDSMGLEWKGFLRLSRIWLPRGEGGCVRRVRPRHPDLRHGHRHRHCGKQGEGHARLHLFGRVQCRIEQAPQQQQHPDDGCARRRR